MSKKHNARTPLTQVIDDLENNPIFRGAVRDPEYVASLDLEGRETEELADAARRVGTGLLDHLSDALRERGIRVMVGNRMVGGPPPRSRQRPQNASGSNTWEAVDPDKLREVRAAFAAGVPVAAGVATAPRVGVTPWPESGPRGKSSGSEPVPCGKSLGSEPSREQASARTNEMDLEKVLSVGAQMYTGALLAREIMAARFGEKATLELLSDLCVHVETAALAAARRQYLEMERSIASDPFWGLDPSGRGGK